MRHMLRKMLLGLFSGGLLLLLPTTTLAYFPPFDFFQTPTVVVDPPPVVIQQVPPDPFVVPVVNQLGDPEPPEPKDPPAVQTPEPASLISGLCAVLCGLFRLHKRHRKAN